MPYLKLDLHVHTVRSYDGHTKTEDLPQIIRKKGLDGLATTEHDKFEPPTFADTLILPGIEISSLDGHLIALGVSKAIEPRLSADETIEQIHKQDGIAIIPHPYDPVCECVKLSRLKVKPDAVESMNADALSFHLSSWLAKRDARRLGLPEVGGSDSHIPQTIGDAYAVIESASREPDDILNAIRMGRVHPEGRPTSISNKLRKLRYKFV